jgi:hypothetical protein
MIILGKFNQAWKDESWIKKKVCGQWCIVIPICPVCQTCNKKKLVILIGPNLEGNENLYSLCVKFHIFHCEMKTKVSHASSSLLPNSLLWTFWHLMIEGGEANRYSPDFSSISMENLKYILVMYNLKKIKLEIQFSVKRTRGEFNYYI